MRKCRFKNEHGYIYGYLMQYGIDCEELRDGIGHFTAAIVEDCSGNMHVIPIPKIEMLPDSMDKTEFLSHKSIFGF